MKSANHCPYLGLMVIGLMLSGYAFADGLKQDTTAAEIAMLPRFCWSQYLDNPPPGPEFRIDCGVGSNHYCPGLVKLIRATKIDGYKHKNVKAQMLHRARKDTIYTLKMMNGNSPACAIRPHVEATLARIDAMIRAAN